MKDLGHLSYFLGLEMTHSTDGLYITQDKYEYRWVLDISDFLVKQESNRFGPLQY